MTPQEINIAIAKKCGKEADYYRDLNAMHEAWLTLSFDERLTFAYWLRSIVRRDYGAKKFDAMFYGSQLTLIANATSAQRAETFCRVFGLWKD